MNNNESNGKVRRRIDKIEVRDHFIRDRIIDALTKEKFDIDEVYFGEGYKEVYILNIYATR